jgi:transposase-like protein
MHHYQAVICPHCQGQDIQKNGVTPHGVQRWHCKECKRYFRLEYRYNACKKGIKEKITEMTLNGSGVRDIGRVLNISKDTVCSALKKNAKNEPLFSYKSGSRSVEGLGNRDTFRGRDG